MVTVLPGAAGSDGVRTTLQITSNPSGDTGTSIVGVVPVELDVQLELRSQVETTEGTVETSAFVSTLEIPTDAEIANLPDAAALEVEIQGGDLNTPLTLQISTGGFETANDLAVELQLSLIHI